MKLKISGLFTMAVLSVQYLLALTGVSRAAITVADQPSSVLGKVMPMGDSITRGNDVPGGYRDPLYNLLTNWLDTFTFVGSATDNPSTTLTAAGQTHHEGHGGYTISAGGAGNLYSNLVTWIGPSGEAPDRILLMIGSNDINLPYDAANAPARLSALIDRIYFYRPGVILYVASIIPNGLGHEPDVLAYNATIPGIVASNQVSGRNVVYVPMHDALNVNTDLADGLHPNAAGYQKMAQVWNEALNTSTTGIVTTTTLDSSVNPSVYGQQVIISATVKTNGVLATQSTGDVVFSVDGVAKAFLAVSGGSAAYTNSTLATGVHTIRAVYVGDGMYAASSVNFAQTNNPGAASKLGFGQQPTTTRPGYAISPAVTVLVQDADGNTVTGDNSTAVTISGTDFSGGSTLTVTASSGVATFSNVCPVTVGSNFTLIASANSLAGSTSSPFNVGVVVISGSFIPPGNTTTTVGTWDSYVISQGQSFIVGNWNTTGAILNQTGGTITFTGAWAGSMGIGSGDGGWGVYNMSGDAVFNATGLNGASSAYSYVIVGRNGSKLTMTNSATANIGSLTLVPYNGSAATVVLSGSASLTVGTLGDATHGYGMGTGCYFDFASGSSATLTITGTHDFTALVNAGSIRIDGAQAYMASFQVAGNTLSLKPVFAGLDHFDITINSALPLTAGTSASFTITAKDGLGATLATFTNTVDFSGTAGITGTSAVFTGGMLSGVSLTPVAAGSNVTLVVVGGGKTGASSPFTVNPGAASKLGFGQQPTTTMPGALISPAVTVLVQDANGNTVTGDNSTEVTISGTTFSGSTLTVTASGGVATFSNLKPMTLTNGIALTANSSPALTTATSSSFMVGPVTIYGDYTPSGTTTIGYGTNYVINTSGGNFLVNSGATLNQTGGVITVTKGWGHFGVGTSGTGVYNMSGDASLIATNLSGGDSGNGTFHIGAGSRLTMTNTAVANIKYMDLKPASGALVARVVLSGYASLTVYGFTDAGTPASSVIGAGSYIDFVSGSLAAFTMTGTHNFTDLVTNGTIRVDGVAQSAFDKFSVSNNTLSLRAPRPEGVMAGKGPAGGIDVEWVASATANGYLVYRSTNDDGSGYGLIGGTSGQTATNYTDRSAKYLINYYYEVSGTNSTGESVKSAPSPAVKLSNPGTMVSVF